MAAYADYTFYSTDYLGTTIASADFARLALRASAVVDNITFNRAAAIIAADTPDATVLAIQNAVCAVAEEIQEEDLSGNLDGVAAESAGSRSVTYNKNSRNTLSNEQKQLNAAKLYLGNTGLLFAGFSSGEYGGQIAEDS